MMSVWYHFLKSRPDIRTWQRDDVQNYIVPTSDGVWKDLNANGPRHRDIIALGHHYDVLTTFCRHLFTTSYRTEPDIRTAFFLDIFTMSSRLSADIYVRPHTKRNPTSERNCLGISLRCPHDFLPISTHDLLPNGTRHRDGIVFGHHNDVPKQFRFDVGFRWIRGWTLKAVESREDIVRMSKNNSVLMSGSVR